MTLQILVTGETQFKVLINYSRVDERIIFNLRIHTIYIPWPTSQEYAILLEILSGHSHE